jgi:hypothetical protein
MFAWHPWEQAFCAKKGLDKPRQCRACRRAAFDGGTTAAWDTQAKKAKNQHDARSRSATGSHIAGKDGLPDRYVTARWKKKLDQPEKFERTVRSWAST